MKRIAVIFAAVAMIAACAPKAEDPALTAVKAKISDLVGGASKITMNTFELVDSTTFAQELEHRIKVQNSALKQNTKLYMEYSAKNMSNNAAKKQMAVSRNNELLAGLQALKDSLGAEKLSQVAYYDYKFSGSAVSESGAKTVFEEYYASVSPDGEVLAVESQQKGLHKALGRVIPGYTELFAGESEEE